MQWDHKRPRWLILGNKADGHDGSGAIGKGPGHGAASGPSI